MRDLGERSHFGIFVLSRLRLIASYSEPKQPRTFRRVRLFKFEVLMACAMSVSEDLF